METGGSLTQKSCAAEKSEIEKKEVIHESSSSIIHLVSCRGRKIIFCTFLPAVGSDYGAASQEKSI